MSIQRLIHLYYTCSEYLTCPTTAHCLCKCRYTGWYTFITHENINDRKWARFQVAGVINSPDAEVVWRMHGTWLIINRWITIKVTSLENVIKWMNLLITRIYPCARRIFFRGGQIMGLGTKVPQRVPGVEPHWGLEAKPPEADDRLW